MKKELIYGIGGLVAGLLITLIVVYKSAPGLMMVEDESKYSFEETVEVFEKEVKAAKWKVAGMHDMQAILADFGHDVKAIKIFELCSSKYSKTILDLDDERIVSPLMPCRVAIYEKSDGKTYITRMNNTLMAKPFGGVINDVMQQASGETEVFISKLIK
ncbi:MAG: DUF302 domain-containing protein [Bacteroidales bacterium]